MEKKTHETAMPGIPKDPAIFEKLAGRGVDYTQIMEIVEFSQPGIPFVFARTFGRRTIKEVLAQIVAWKELLAEDFLLLPEDKAKVTSIIKKAEMFVWAVIRDCNYRVGNWTIRWYATLPEGELMSGSIVRATHEETKEVRTHALPGRPRGNAGDFAKDMQEVFAGLGLSDQLWLKSPYRLLMNKRSPKGWPVHTRVIPMLYDLLLPHYQHPGHYSEKRDGCAGSAPPARYPKDLLEDMLTILQTHHPEFLADLTTKQIKAHIQRHLDRQQLKQPRSTP